MIGPLIASIPALFVAFSMGVDKFALALLAVLFVQQVETNVLVPFILGKSMELNPVNILFFTLAMSSLFGEAKPHRNETPTAPSPLQTHDDRSV